MGIVKKRAQANCKEFSIIYSFVHLGNYRVFLFVFYIAELSSVSMYLRPNNSNGLRNGIHHLRGTGSFWSAKL